MLNSSFLVFFFWSSSLGVFLISGLELGTVPWVRQGLFSSYHPAKAFTSFFFVETLFRQVSFRIFPERAPTPMGSGFFHSSSFHLLRELSLLPKFTDMEGLTPPHGREKLIPPRMLRRSEFSPGESVRRHAFVLLRPPVSETLFPTRNPELFS